MPDPLCFDDLPLRERKRARLHLDLVEALVVRLAERSLDEIGVGELAAAATTSEATFFNHFPSKQHLLTYF
ncbi:MAG TPA: TetR family transcriptional regulator, partial [Deltaproteobacteria bacterium]|nr:TetR family transcriptional regulator [Deltaproteobacteria bacterium]